MGFFRNLFRSGNDSSLDDILNPLAGMRLREFAITGSLLMKHYFRFENKEHKSEEFVVMYDCFDGQLIYSRTLYRRAGEDEFSKLSEHVWARSISHLIGLGKSRSATTRPTPNHFVSDLGG